MRDGLYHKELGLPALAFRATARRPHYTPHALTACLNDRYGQILPPASITLKAEQVVEVEVRGGKVEKIVVRLPYNDRFDLVAALCNFSADSVTVKTVWLNERNDTHATLNRSLYVQP